MKSLDLNGQIFGDWTVLRVGTYKGTHKQWWCKCKCGTEIEVLQTSLVRGASHSCGCWKTRVGKDNCNWNGCGELTGTQWAGIKSGAKNRKIHFDLLINDVWNLFLCQNKTCKLSGLPLKFAKSYALAKQHCDETTASLDRIDSSKGYIIGNVQWVHKDINMMKRTLSEEKFIELCKLVSKKFP